MADQKVFRKGHHWDSWTVLHLAYLSAPHSARPSEHQWVVQKEFHWAGSKVDRKAEMWDAQTAQHSVKQSEIQMVHCSVNSLAATTARQMVHQLVAP